MMECLFFYGHNGLLDLFSLKSRKVQQKKGYDRIEYCEIINVYGVFVRISIIYMKIFPNGREYPPENGFTLYVNTFEARCNHCDNINPRAPQKYYEGHIVRCEQC